MLHLTYISTAKNVSEDDVADVLAASRRNNARDGITGLLMFNGKRFLQSLEGPAPLVEAAYNRIKADRRHRAPVLLASRTVDVRQFGDWEMAFEQVRAFEQSKALIAKADELVAGVTDPNVRAQFSSYARLAMAA